MKILLDCHVGSLLAITAFFYGFVARPVLSPTEFEKIAQLVARKKNGDLTELEKIRAKLAILQNLFVTRPNDVRFIKNILNQNTQAASMLQAQLRCIQEQLAAERAAQGVVAGAAPLVPIAPGPSMQAPAPAPPGYGLPAASGVVPASAAFAGGGSGSGISQGGWGPGMYHLSSPPAPPGYPPTAYPYSHSYPSGGGYDPRFQHQAYYPVAPPGTPHVSGGAGPSSVPPGPPQPFYPGQQ